jgi:S-adenosylhomocysteine hydrolase
MADSKVKDLSLADFGRKELNMAESTFYFSIFYHMNFHQQCLFGNVFPLDSCVQCQTIKKFCFTFQNMNCV